MSGVSPVVARLLRAIFHQPIIEPDSESGIIRLAALAGQDIAPADWHAAVADAVRSGLVHDPVRLPPGALQCHWHLELTALGVQAVREGEAG